MIEMKILEVDSYKDIVAFDKLCFPADYWKEEDWKELLSDNRATYYALMDRDIIVGDIFTYNWKGENDYLKIMNIAIHPDYRKQGLGYKLMGYAMDEFKASGLDRIAAETRASNVAMQALFKKCGYEFNKAEEDYYSNPSEAGYKYVFTQS